jgi:hypothetical protein
VAVLSTVATGVHNHRIYLFDRRRPPHSRPGTVTKGQDVTMDMHLSLLVSPGSLSRLHDDLTSAATTVGRIASHTEALAGASGWHGAAEHVFAAKARSAGAQCEAVSRRLQADAARVDRLAEELVDEFRVLQQLEDQLVGLVHELARRALEDTTGEATEVYERVRHLLPAHLSPHWRSVASTIGHLL